MKKDTPRDRVIKRRESSSKELWTLAHANKQTDKSITSTYVQVGLTLGITGQTVYNYVNGKGGDGYIIDALIEEFKKLPTQNK